MGLTSARAVCSGLMQFIRSDPQQSLLYGANTTPLLGDPTWSDQVGRYLIEPLLDMVSGDVTPFSIQILLFLAPGEKGAVDGARGDRIGFHRDPPGYTCIAGYNLQVRRLNYQYCRCPVRRERTNHRVRCHCRAPSSSACTASASRTTAWWSPRAICTS